MTNDFPIPMCDFQEWLVHHTGLGHQILRCDDPRVSACGFVCIECQDWQKVTLLEWDAHPEMAGFQPSEALFEERTFTWKSSDVPEGEE
jgi:hypothetical protein